MNPGMKARLALLKHRVKSDVSGLAAIEFALIAPLLLAMLMGVVEISRAISMNRKFSTVTSTIADLVTRQNDIKATDVATMNQIVASIMMPYGADELSYAIIPVRASLTNAADVRVYACSAARPPYHGANQYSRNQTYEIPQNMLTAASTMIVVEAYYQYVPLFLNGLMQPIEWSDKAYRNPRQGCISFNDNSCNLTPTCS